MRRVEAAHPELGRHFAHSLRTGTFCSYSPERAVAWRLVDEIAPNSKLEAKIAERTKEYEARFANPFVAASMGFIDEVIMPTSTRKRIAVQLANA